MKHSIIISTVLITIFFFSCNDSDIVRSELPDFWAEHHKIEWDSASTANHLIGTWKLTYRYCCPYSATEGSIKNVENENFQLSITPDKIHVFINGDLVQESNWSVEVRDVELFGLVADPYVKNTFGRILFAKDMVLFNGSYIDGEDNYFKKVTKSMEGS